MQMQKRSAVLAAALISVAAFFSAGVVSAEQIHLTGSGATFPFPIYSVWFKDYNQVHKDVQVNYQGKGSGAGIKDFMNHTVDFAGSDVAMKDEEMGKVKEGVQLLPMTAGSIVLAYNLPGSPKGLKLSREAYFEDLPDKDQEVERSAHRKGQPRDEDA